MRKNPYDFRNFYKSKMEKPKAKENEILIYGPISEFAWFGDEVTPKSIIEQLEGMAEAEEINVRINSIGGDVFAGVAIHNALSQHESKVIVTVDGFAASAASLIAMAGDSIRMHDNAIMMIHDPWTFAIGNAEELTKTAEVLETISGGMVNTYSARSGQDKDTVRQMMRDETWLNAEEAKEQGFSDEIIESKKKDQAKAKADLSFFSNVPDWVREACGMERSPEGKDKQTKQVHVNVDISKEALDKVVKDVVEDIKIGLHDKDSEIMKGLREKVTKFEPEPEAESLELLEKEIEIMEMQ